MTRSFLLLRISWSCLQQKLSVWVLQALSDNNDVIMTVYVDDVVFSSEHNISSEFRKTVLSLIRKYNYQVSRKKVKGYSRTYPKLVTGVIINSEGKATVKNSLRKKIMFEHEYLRNNPTDKKSSASTWPCYCCQTG